MEDFGITKRIAEEANQTQSLLLLDSFVSQPVPWKRDDSNLGVNQSEFKLSKTETNSNLLSPFELTDKQVKSAERPTAAMADALDGIIKNARAMISASSIPPLETGVTEVPKGKALLDGKGEFLQMVDDKYKAKPGERVENSNLLVRDYKVEQLQSGANKGKYLVSQTIEAKQAPIFAYMNFGATNVGLPKTIDSKLYGPDDYVPVKNGDKVELVKAKDLEAHRFLRENGLKSPQLPPFDYPWKK